MTESDRDPESSWLDDIDFDPEGSWLRMGTRLLGDRPWLVADSRREAELALKAALLANRHNEVFAALPGCETAARETLDLVIAEVATMGISQPEVNMSLHPLDAAGRCVQEDLCLLRREPEGWVLVAASLCFPSRWRLADKIGRTLNAVHHPVEGYETNLAKGVDALLDGLGARIVLRRNWVIHAESALFQLDRPVGLDPVVDADRCLDDLYLRSERQTLRRVNDAYALFTIRIQQDRLARVVASARRGRLLHTFVSEATEAEATHRGLGRAQCRSLQACLDAKPWGSGRSDFDP